MSGGNITVQRTGQGIPVITETIDDCRISGYMVAVGTGSRDEAVGEWGISHLLEHSVFRAAGDRSSFQMSKEIEGAGGELNAFTGKELTAFYGMTIKGAESIAKSIVADIVCDPLLKPEDVEMEKKIVIQEIGMGENDPSSYIHTLFSETMWGSSELGHYVAGSVESVGRMDDVCLRRYYSDKYVGSNIAVFACGAVDPSDALEWAEEHFDALPKGVSNKRTVPKACGCRYVHYPRKEEHCYVGMGFPAFPANHPDMPALSLLSAVMGSGMSSRLFQSVREEKALVYSVYNAVGKSSDASTFAAYFSSTEENLLNAIETIGASYRELLDGGVSQEELDRARNLVKGSLIRRNESTRNRMNDLAQSYMMGMEPRGLGERIAELDGVTIEDLARVAEKVIRTDSLAVAMYGRDVGSMKDFNPASIEL